MAFTTTRRIIIMLIVIVVAFFFIGLVQGVDIEGLFKAELPQDEFHIGNGGPQPGNIELTPWTHITSKDHETGEDLNFFTVTEVACFLSEDILTDLIHFGLDKDLRKDTYENQIHHYGDDKFILALRRINLGGLDSTPDGSTNGNDILEYENNEISSANLECGNPVESYTGDVDEASVMYDLKLKTIGLVPFCEKWTANNGDDIEFDDDDVFDNGLWCGDDCTCGDGNDIYEFSGSTAKGIPTAHGGQDVIDILSGGNIEPWTMFLSNYIDSEEMEDERTISGDNLVTTLSAYKNNDYIRYIITNHPTPDERAEYEFTKEGLFVLLSYIYDRDKQYIDDNYGTSLGGENLNKLSFRKTMEGYFTTDLREKLDADVTFSEDILIQHLIGENGPVPKGDHKGIEYNHCGSLYECNIPRLVEVKDLDNNDFHKNLNLYLVNLRTNIPTKNHQIIANVKYKLKLINWYTTYNKDWQSDYDLHLDRIIIIYQYTCSINDDCGNGFTCYTPNEGTPEEGEKYCLKS